MKTVLITGASSGIGRATVLAFAKAGWNVAATARKPDASMFAGQQNVHTFTLDVTKPDSITKTFAAVQKQFGTIDVVINNAGYGTQGIFEAMSDDIVRAQFDTNVFGLMRVTRAAISVMRQQGFGSIVQISSMGGRLTFPAYSLYHSSKWAVEGFNESLQYELRGTGIKLKLIEPGIIKTAFYKTAEELVMPTDDTGYKAFIRSVKQRTRGVERAGSPAEVVAQKVLKAATSTSYKLRYAVGGYAPILLFLRKCLPDRTYFYVIRRLYRL